MNYAEKDLFLKNYYKEPSIHLVFKDEKYIEQVKSQITLTTEKSGFINKKKPIREIPGYYEGNWWVQDLSTSIPLYEISKKNQEMKFIDLCSAPGGKAFQILSKNNNVTLNDKNKERIEMLKVNLKRLKLNPKIMNFDVMDMKITEKYDFIIIDAPCSSVGTIRRNPEIFFKNKKPDFLKLLNIQEKMLNKAKSLLKSEGTILYMTCSFLKIETFDQVNKFLKSNQNFYLDKSNFNQENSPFTKFIKDKFFYTLPTSYINYNIDGFFAAYLRKGIR